VVTDRVDGEPRKKTTLGGRRESRGFLLRNGEEGPALEGEYHRWVEDQKEDSSVELREGKEGEQAGRQRKKAGLKRRIQKSK